MSARRERHVFVVLSRGDTTDDWETEIIFRERRRAHSYVAREMKDAPEEVDPDDFFRIERTVLR